MSYVASKQTDGTWAWTGPVPEGKKTPAEVLLDADKKALPFATADDAIQLVNTQIALPENLHYRYEVLAGADCSAATRALPFQKPAPADDSKWTPEEEKWVAHLQETEGLNRKSALQKMRRAQKRGQEFPGATMVGTAKGGNTGKGRKAKAVKPAREKKAKAPAQPKTKAPTWQERRAAVLASPKFQAAFAKARKDDDRKECKHGHAIKPENIHVGDLFRMGKITCFVCNTLAQKRYLKESAK